MNKFFDKYNVFVHNFIRHRIQCVAEMATSTLGAAWLVDENNQIVKKKSKRIAKHKKKAWRITSNVEDVERFLESKRLDERLGYAGVKHHHIKPSSSNNYY